MSILSTGIPKVSPEPISSEQVTIFPHFSNVVLAHVVSPKVTGTGIIIGGNTEVRTCLISASRTMICTTPPMPIFPHYLLTFGRPHYIRRNKVA